MDTDTNTENNHAPSTKEYDEAIAMGQEIESQVTDLVSFYTPIGLEAQFATIVIAFFYPAVWAVVVFFYVVVCVSSAKRLEVRECLKKRDIEGAKKAFEAAKTWNSMMVLTEIAMGVIEVWGLFQLIKSFKG